MWTLDADNPLSLRGSDGKTIDLPYRKVGEVLTLLAEHPGSLLDRANVANCLWPALDREAGLANLRQCLLKLRLALGSDAIKSTRTACGLNPDFPVGLERQPKPQSAAPLKAFADLVIWLASSSPKQMLELLRITPDFALALPQRDLARVVTATSNTPQSREVKGWVSYWQGYGLIFEDLPRAHRLLRVAMEHGTWSKDHVLAEHASYWCGISNLLLGRTGEARRVASTAQQSIPSQTGSCYSRKLDTLMATILLHEGRVLEGCERLEMIGLSAAASESDQAFEEALRALYLAYAGHYRQASEILSSINRVYDHAGISACRSLTMALCDSSDTNKEGAENLEALANRFSQVGECYMELYSREAAAVHFSRQRKWSESKRVLSDCKALRTKLGAVKTGWDKSRLAPLYQ